MVYAVVKEYDNNTTSYKYFTDIKEATIELQNTQLYGRDNIIFSDIVEMDDVIDWSIEEVI